jgi:hypothetical protein
MQLRVAAAKIGINEAHLHIMQWIQSVIHYTVKSAQIQQASAQAFHDLLIQDLVIQDLVIQIPIERTWSYMNDSSCLHCLI